MRLEQEYLVRASKRARKGKKTTPQNDRPKKKGKGRGATACERELV